MGDGEAAAKGRDETPEPVDTPPVDTPARTEGEGAGPDPEGPGAGDHASAPSPRLGRSLWVATVLLTVVQVVFQTYNRFDIGVLFDDAYFFQRYADNLLHGDGLSWQPGGEPTYGLTEPLFVVPSALFRALTGHPSVASALSSAVFGIVLLVATVVLLWRHVAASRQARAAAALLFLFCVTSTLTLDHFGTGMGTTFAMSYQAALLLVARRFEVRPSRDRAVALGVLGGLAFWVRPELVALPLCIAAMMTLRPPEGARRRVALALGVTVATLGLILLVNQLYFATALPLPFYAKSTGLYEGSLEKAYRGVASQHLLDFLGGHWPLWLVVGLDVLGGLRSYRQRAPGLDQGTLVATVVFLLYYWLLALPVMGDGARFYQPAVVPLAFLAARALGRWEGALSARFGEPGRAVIVGAACVLMLGMWSALAPKVVESGKVFAWKVARQRPHFNIEKHTKVANGPLTYWYKVGELSELPDDLVMAATEVGYLGMLNPKKRVIDIAGLNERAFALQPFDAALLLDGMRPDLIYMPHADYQKMIRAIEQSPHFAAYEHFGTGYTRTRKFGVAIRRDSPHYEAMRDIIAGKKHLPHKDGRKETRGK